MIHKVIRITLLVSGLILLLFSQQLMNQPKKNSNNYIIVQPDQAEKPKQELSSNYVSGIKPYAKIEKEKFVLPPEPPINSVVPVSTKTIDSFDTSIHLYRRKIILETQANQIPLKDYIVSIELDILSLIRESKISFSCDQIYFTDEDGKTVIPHWIEHGCDKGIAKFWICIPSIQPKTTKGIFCYYGNDTRYTYSNSKTTFQPEKDLLGWYYFINPNRQKIIDFSGHGNDGNLSRISFPYNWSFREPEYQGPYIFFSDWQSWFQKDTWFNNDSVYFSVPSNSMKSLAKVGSIELRFKMFYLSEQIIQRFFVDSNQQLEIGFSYNGNIFFQNGKSTNRIFYNTKLEQGEWYHFVCAWDLAKKSVNIYINGNHIQQIPQSTPFIWKQSKPLGTLEFGGYHTTDNDYGFAGYLDCLRIYNKALSPSEVLRYLQINKETLRYPKTSILKEEKVSSINQSYQKIDFKDLTKYPKTEKVKINLLYASSLNQGWWYSDESSVTTEKDPTMIIDRLRDYDEPIFGFSSHFYPFLGTQILVKEKFLVNYVGFKINDPSLIKNLKINFAWYYEYHEKGYYQETGFLHHFCPSAIACEPGYSYEDLGSSDLEYYCAVNGIYWYKLKIPIFINPSISIMQIVYKPTQKIGLIRLEMADMLLMNQKKQFVRSVFFQKDPVEIEERRSSPKDIIFVPQYKASLLPIEKGYIDFRKNKENGLDLVLANQGYDNTILDDVTFSYIKSNLFSNIQILNWKKKLIADISVDNIKDHLSNMKLESSYLLHIPIMDSNDLPKNNVYYITLSDRANSNQYDDSNPLKIISWILGKDPYRYNYEEFNGNRLLYELWIANDGSFRFTQPKED